jgi:hypothetical protein
MSHAYCCFRTLQKSGCVLTASLFLTVLTTFGAVYGADGAATAARQAEVATRGAQVMPFDLEQTMHVFQSLEDGGLQAVTAKDPANREQIALIQAHLKAEADKFRRGDFSDPATIHGQDMPGLAALQAGAGQIDVHYTPLPDGGQIRYTTTEPALVHAIHQWFTAQRADHGRHASGH